MSNVGGKDDVVGHANGIRQKKKKTFVQVLRSRSDRSKFISMTLDEVLT